MANYEQFCLEREKQGEAMEGGENGEQCTERSAGMNK